LPQGVKFPGSSLSAGSWGRREKTKSIEKCKGLATAFSVISRERLAGKRKHGRIRCSHDREKRAERGVARRM